MTKRKIGTKRTKRVRNPLMSRPAGVPRPRLAFDGSNLVSTTYIGVPTTAANAAKGCITIDCDAANNPAVSAGASNGLNSISNAYSEYKYMSCNVEYIPSVGPAGADAASRIHIAYIDNPEKMFTFFGLATGIAAINAVRGAKTVRSFNAWERFTYNVPLTYRRKMFDVNNTVVPGVDVYDRSTQGMIILYVESISAIASVGTFKVNSKIHLTGLDINIGT